ncbi:HAMP domain-containing methyl-accepting chemotaxis protein [Neorhizobium alkalisoli]|uniref:HAMP domain-containing methyl-accepting chemotaxis protein n=1 Tax=Neorhizobium alkalisoli TaxID=528178 RepID=UPI000CFA05EB|nr:HAMP domain-containing methyl-accepting chemotaxis protein [Neorhizobium alkalisoli]
MRKPKVKTSLVVINLMFGLIFLAFALFSLASMHKIHDDTTAIADKWLPSVSKVRTIRFELEQLKFAYANHIMSISDEAIATAELSVSGHLAELTNAVSHYRPLVSSTSEADLLQRIEKHLADYQKSAVPMLEKSRLNQNEDAKRIFYSDMEPLVHDAEKLVDQLLGIKVAGSEASHASSEATYSTVLQVTWIVIVLVLSIVVAAVCYVAWQISRPIGTITEAMAKLAAGDTQSQIPYSNRHDEIGTMAGAVEVFRQTALAKISADRQAETDRSLAESERQIREQSDQARAEVMAQVTTRLAAGLKQLAQGDLTTEIKDPFDPDFEALRSDFNATVHQLSQTLAKVAGSTVNIDSGSAEIANSANDLARRTEQQASALEETAAALDQVTANVTSASRRADEARQVAADANTSATASGEIVDEAVQAMSRIKDSSNQISSIIGVIDEIAFQTNLLALNAGVEAARAGEAGKGFAVVAQEVRELAQRSAQAAKEIKALIQTSTGEVASGVDLVSKTGESLKNIVRLIVVMNQHVEAIAVSAREQSLGLSEINTAVNSLDQTTQQNAAMVEETSAASVSLADECAALRQLISQFTIPGTARNTPYDLRKIA